MMKYLLPLVLFLSCAHRQGGTPRVTIFKQWHMPPNINTFNVDVGPSLPHYENQRDIYDQLAAAAEDDLTVIAEGCQAGVEIDEHFGTSFNGWNMTNLALHVDRDHYKDILTSVPLKVKAKFPETKVVCGDSEELIRKNLMDLSEARGYLGFYYRLEQNKNNRKKYDSYLKALEESENRKIDDPLKFAEQKALGHVSSFWLGVARRNAWFVDTAKKLRNENPVIVIGGLHANDLEKQLKKEGFEVTVITPKGYPEKIENLGEELFKGVQK